MPGLVQQYVEKQQHKVWRGVELHANPETGIIPVPVYSVGRKLEFEPGAPVIFKETHYQDGRLYHKPLRPAIVTGCEMVGNQTRYATLVHMADGRTSESHFHSSETGLLHAPSEIQTAAFREEFIQLENIWIAARECHRMIDPDARNQIAELHRDVVALEQQYVSPVTHSSDRPNISRILTQIEEAIETIRDAAVQELTIDYLGESERVLDHHSRATSLENVESALAGTREPLLRELGLGFYYSGERTAGERVHNAQSYCRS